ncbi:CPBP family intramembrane glutamic endopeptidase [Halorientalis pallida]|uniref:CPBP family intramembrane metalloprotease n=1 Tax=Halorientalis pallida TaxID=2479928 RepID=A0A498L1G6_9EURY|nr:type II CAAX endopeptidase family protein [Halorientalis pallida]RXK47401.1 CPBP family intramembrane metalloprotease [Halorientalis pallida]
MAAVDAVDGRGPRTTAAPTTGLVLAGIALAASVLPWTGGTPVVAVPGVDGSVVGLVLGAGAALVFSLRRHGTVDRRLGAPVAGVLSLSLFGYALYQLMRPAIGTDVVPAVGIGLPVAALAGLGAAAVAVADYDAIADDAFWGRVKGFTVALAIGGGAFIGLFVGQLFALPLYPPDTALEYSVVTTIGYLGSVGFVVLYLRGRRLSFDYVDVSVPSARDLLVAAGGLFCLLLLLGTVTTLIQQLGLPSSESRIQQQAMENPTLALSLVALSILVIAPVEELAYRNVVQKYLYEWFTERSAVVLGAAVFAAVHFSQYQNANPLATLTTLTVIFFLSLLLGYVYYRTENLVVPILVHGAFNALQFLAVYFQATGQIPAA